MPPHTSPEPPVTPRDGAPVSATPARTADLARRFASRFCADFYRPSALAVTVSSIGFGTYLGDITNEADDAYVAAICRAVEFGVNEAFPGCATHAQRAIAFSRSLPGMSAALVGMKKAAHVDENLDAARP